jgi:predicted peptidase
VRYTEYPQGNHNAWDATYADPALWAWLFAQRRR